MDTIIKWFHNNIKFRKKIIFGGGGGEVGGGGVVVRGHVQYFGQHLHARWDKFGVEDLGWRYCGWRRGQRFFVMSKLKTLIFHPTGYHRYHR